VAVGFTAFAALMLVLAGFYQVMMGLVAVLNQDFYVATPNYVFAFDAGLWGWIHLVLGAVVIGAGLGVLSGQTWGRVVGIVLAIISALQAFAFIPYHPIWSLVVIALAVMVIWALTMRISVTYEEERPPREEY
jgi:hypothetical protein